MGSTSNMPRKFSGSVTSFGFHEKVECKEGAYHVHLVSKIGFYNPTTAAWSSVIQSNFMSEGLRQTLAAVKSVRATEQPRPWISKFRRHMQVQVHMVLAADAQAFLCHLMV